jgi:glycosyltransferase involved in cell wall biosynthesis
MDYIRELKELGGFYIFISGKNIRPYLELASESVLTFYPMFKDNIVIFDDDSTDDTKAWAESKGYKVITWSRFSNDEKNITVRVNKIYNECFLYAHKNNVMYALFLDGDIIIKSQATLKIMFKEVIHKKANIIGILDKTIFSIPNHNYDDIFNSNNPDICPLTLERYNDKVYHKRIWMGLAFMDIQLLIDKEHLYFDNIESKEVNDKYSRYLYGCYDSGTYFFNEILRRKIYYSTADYLGKQGVNWNPYFFHFGGVACEKQSPDNAWTNDYREENLRIIKYDPFLQELFKKCNFVY